TDPTELFGLPGSAALSAAEKRDYDQRFAARQLLFCSPRSTSSSITSLRPVPLAAQPRRPLLPPCFPFRAAFPAARKRRDSKQRNPITQVIFKKIAKKTGAVTAPVSSSLAYPFAPACRRQKPQ
ncbi:hypothetical protein, partial [Burkholderia glumae]|uniref:hypothetical protein n=1 Tax=Burkholderia glumae TaxID=337 RepID=UPI001C89D751